MELLTLILVVVIAFQVGKYYGYYKLAKIMREVAAEQGLDLEVELGLVEPEDKVDVVFKLEVEEHGKLLYLFDKETHNFICQADTLQELAKLAKELKNVNLAAVKHGDKIFAFKDGVSVEVV